ncbi:protein trichome birefringence-like 9 [Tasmannia lanceolata]|uniref:protein trichome birefringence-like 9 n=1 Tax=Tasmannia lanceolata TaxID=3420 RepID=UPI004064A35B
MLSPLSFILSFKAIDKANHILLMDQNTLFSFKTFKKEIAYALSFLFLLLSFLVIFDIIESFQPQDLARIGFLSEILPYNKNPASKAYDYSNGRWVWDESYPNRSYTEDCPFLDIGFQCHRNGRSDRDYLKWRWQPDGCDLPRFNASEMLERSRGGRIVFVGDSLGRNQWESLVCMLAKAVPNHSSIYEQNGNPITKHDGYLSIRFNTYNFTLEYYKLPFLVIVDHPPKNSSQEIQGVIRVDKLHWHFEKLVGAETLIFNAGHFWNQDKTIDMGRYFQEGEAVNMSMGVEEAFRRSLQTWKQWVVENLDLERSHVFFRSYSPVHYRGGTWRDRGECKTSTNPETNYAELEAEPWYNPIISETIEQIKGAKRRVQILNITYLTKFRKDGHPSIHREPGTPVPIIQDCSHWCLPGVPDTWNELLYAYLLSEGYTTKKEKMRSKYRVT